MKGIKLCGECGNYDYKKHRCRIGCIDDSNAQAYFYGDCPLPDVVPKSEVDLYKRPNDELEDELASTYDKLENAKAEVAREIFADIDTLIEWHKDGEIDNEYLYEALGDIKNKHGVKQ